MSCHQLGLATQVCTDLRVAQIRNPVLHRSQPRRAQASSPRRHSLAGAARRTVPGLLRSGGHASNVTCYGRDCNRRFSLKLRPTARSGMESKMSCRCSDSRRRYFGLRQGGSGNDGDIPLICPTRQIYFVKYEGGPGVAGYCAWGCFRVFCLPLPEPDLVMPGAPGAIGLSCPPSAQQ
jgi:hypothetical protein